jgi:hypothetical protein
MPLDAVRCEIPPLPKCVTIRSRAQGRMGVFHYPDSSALGSDRSLPNLLADGGVRVRRTDAGRRALGVLPNTQAGPAISYEEFYFVYFNRPFSVYQ